MRCHSNPNGHASASPPARHPTTNVYNYRVDLSQRVTIDPEQCGGRPCIRGMRIRVVDVLDMLGAGMSEAEILEEFPYLGHEDILIHFAA